MFRFRDDVGLALGLLLGDLLLLDGARELLAEDEVRDRDVVQNNVEVVRALRERTTDLGPVRVSLDVFVIGVSCVLERAARSKDGD